MRAVTDFFKVKGSTLREVKSAMNEKYESPKFGIRDGKIRADKKGYGAGTLFASLSTQQAPGVVDRNKEPISPGHGNADTIFAGCTCRATIAVYCYDQSGGRGYALGLNNLQLIGTGPRLDNRTNANEDFDDDFLMDAQDADEPQFEDAE